MENTLNKFYVETPVSILPDEEGWYMTIIPQENKIGDYIYYRYGYWYEDDWAAKLNVPIKKWPVPVYYLLPMTREQVKELVREAWEAGYNVIKK